MALDSAAMYLSQEQWPIVATWMSGELSEGLAVRLLDTDRLILREFREHILAEGLRAAAAWRAQHPLEVPR